MVEKDRQVMEATTDILDLETCFGGGRLATFNVSRLAGMPNVQVGDRIVVDMDAKPKAGDWLALSMPGAKFFVGECTRGRRGLWATSSLGFYRLSEVRVLGVVRGLVRVFGREGR
jgi:hypothetical protein